MLVPLDAPEPIERFARRNLPLHIYEVGDLDPAFWSRTRFWGWFEPDGEMSALALLYDSPATPTLVALEDEGSDASARLLIAIRDQLPARMYAHLSPGLISPLRSRWQPRHCGRHDKMLL